MSAPSFETPLGYRSNVGPIRRRRRLLRRRHRGRRRWPRRTGDDGDRSSILPVFFALNSLPVPTITWSRSIVQFYEKNVPFTTFLLLDASAASSSKKTIIKIIFFNSTFYSLSVVPMVHFLSRIIVGFVISPFSIRSRIFLVLSRVEINQKHSLKKTHRIA